MCSSDLPDQLTVMGDSLFFTATDSAHGTELWKSDGSSTGTAILADLNPGAASSQPSRLIVSGNKLFFYFVNATSGRELGVSDGTAQGTHLVKDIQTGTGNGTPINGKIIPFDNQVVFAGADGSTGIEPWISDGTEQGTVLLKDIHPGAGNTFGGPGVDSAVINGKLFFVGNDGTSSNAHGSEVWITDGTTAGTTLLKDIYPEIGRAHV